MEIALLSWYIYLMWILWQSLTENSYHCHRIVGVAIDIDKCTRATNVENKINTILMDVYFIFSCLHSNTLQHYFCYNTDVKIVLLRIDMHHLLDVWDYHQPDREHRNNARILKISTVVHKAHRAHKNRNVTRSHKQQMFACGMYDDNLWCVCGKCKLKYPLK